LVPFIVSVFESRLDHDASEIRAAFPTMQAMVEHLLGQDDEHVEAKDKARLREIILRIQA